MLHWSLALHSCPSAPHQWMLHCRQVHAGISGMSDVDVVGGLECICVQRVLGSMHPTFKHGLMDSATPFCKYASIQYEHALFMHAASWRQAAISWKHQAATWMSWPAPRHLRSSCMQRPPTTRAPLTGLHPCRVTTTQSSRCFEQLNCSPSLCSGPA